MCVYKCFNSCELLCAYCLVVREVESYAGLVNVGACLLNVVAENASESRLKKVASGVVTHDSRALHVGDVSYNCITNGKNTLSNCTKVHVDAVGLLCIVYVEKNAVAVDGTCVTNLTTALAVEGSTVKDNCAVTLGYGVNYLTVG